MDLDEVMANADLEAHEKFLLLGMKLGSSEPVEKSRFAQAH